MKRKWFTDTLKQALPPGLSDHSLVADCAKRMETIATLMGSTAVDDGARDETTEKREALRALGHALRRYADGFLGDARGADTDHDYYYEYTASADGVMRPAKLKPKVNINTATLRELVDLPGIGEALASRLIRHRHLNGPFDDIAQVKAIKGMTDVRYNKFHFMITAGHAGVVRSVPDDVAKFFADPTVANFLGFLIAHPGGRHGDRVDVALLSRASETLAIVANMALTAPLSSRQLLGATRSTSMKAVDDADALAQAFDDAAPTDLEGTGLLLDSQYRAFIEMAIDGAQSHIDIAMFYISLSESPDHPNSAILEKIGAAKRRGVTVRVILDKDKEGDLYLSREINKPAFERFSQMGVDVRFDVETTLLHTKLVVFDRAIVVVGSHNWTAGSYFKFDDVSVFVRSRKLADHYTAWFDKQFA